MCRAGRVLKYKDYRPMCLQREFSKRTHAVDVLDRWSLDYEIDKHYGCEVFLKTLPKGIMCWVAGRSNQYTTGFMTEKVSSNAYEQPYMLDRWPLKKLRCDFNGWGRGLLKCPHSRRMCWIAGRCKNDNLFSMAGEGFLRNPLDTMNGPSCGYQKSIAALHAWRGVSQ